MIYSYLQSRGSTEKLPPNSKLKSENITWNKERLLVIIDRASTAHFSSYNISSSCDNELLRNVGLLLGHKVLE